jgi:predicted exporter
MPRCQAADHLQHRLEASHRFRALRLRHGGNDLARIGALYFPHRFQLLSSRTREQLRNADWSAFERDLAARYFSPASALSSELVRNDPFLLLPGFLGELAALARGRLKVDEGYLSAASGDQHLVLVAAELAGSPFSFEAQARRAGR